ncbi:hypothetical protein [Trebonia sp.]|uniref:hypothetical protein n=1 Tax=Trebonia sp. TaxID=2767075 RepID=UPI002604CBDF|nr:hypothetical protein [Trebonia sp.]
MAHYIAEQITAAESAAESDREAKEQAAAESILALWQRHAGLPGGHPPMHAFGRVFLALDRLAEPQDPWRFYRPFPADAEPSTEEVISDTLLSLALRVEDSAREIVRALIAEAAATALDREARWIRLSETVAEDEERRAIRQLGRLARLAEESTCNPEEMESLDRVQANIMRTIGQLTVISDAITEVRRGKER